MIALQVIGTLMTIFLFILGVLVMLILMPLSDNILKAAVQVTVFTIGTLFLGSIMITGIAFLWVGL